MQAGSECSGGLGAGLLHKGGAYETKPMEGSETNHGDIEANRNPVHHWSLRSLSLNEPKPGFAILERGIQDIAKEEKSSQDEDGGENRETSEWVVGILQDQELGIEHGWRLTNEANRSPPAPRR